MVKRQDGNEDHSTGTRISYQLGELQTGQDNLSKSLDRLRENVERIEATFAGINGVFTRVDRLEQRAVRLDSEWKWSKQTRLAALASMITASLMFAGSWFWDRFIGGK